jgi:hypothetical protein
LRGIETEAGNAGEGWEAGGSRDDRALGLEGREGGEAGAKVRTGPRVGRSGRILYFEMRRMRRSIRERSYAVESRHRRVVVV